MINCQFVPWKFSQKLFFQNHSFESCEKILNENTQSEQKEEIENLIKLSNFS